MADTTLYLSPQPSAAKKMVQFAAVNGCGPNDTETTDSTTGNQHFVLDSTDALCSWLAAGWGLA